MRPNVQHETQPLRERMFPGWLWRLPPGSRSIALTFDDGPHPDTTPELIAMLARLNISSTHFVLGERCRSHPALVRELAAGGHAIANHTFRHEDLFWRSAAYQRSSISATEQTLREIAGGSSGCVRPPFGRFNWWTLRVLRQLGLRGVLWSVIAQDWVPQDEQRLWSRLSTRLHEGAIIVLHDAQATTPLMVRVLPRLADEVRRRGWDFCLLPPVHE